MFSGIKYSAISVYNCFKYHLLFGKKNHNLLSLKEICEILNVSIPDKLSAKKNDLYFVCYKKIFYIRKSVVMAGMLKEASVYHAIKRHKNIIISEKEIPGQTYILVENETEAFQKLIEACSAKITAKKIVVTGSTGKTSAKQFCQIVLSEYKKTFCAVHNLNAIKSQGSLLQLLPRDAEFFVQEVDEGDPGLVGLASELIKPDYAIITNVGMSHIQNFGTQEELGDNICEIAKGLDPRHGTVLYNFDDEFLRNYHWGVRSISCSLEDPHADCYCSEIRQLSNRTTVFNIHFMGQKSELSIKTIGKHNLYNAMYSFVVSTLCGESYEQSKKALLKYHATGARQNFIKTNSNLLYVDCFNAAPNSFKTAINTLDELQCSKQCKKVAVLGDMAEFGTESENAHKAVAEYINKTASIDSVILYGELMSEIYPLIDRDRIDVYQTTQMKDAINYCKKFKGNNNVILFKGSRCMHLETIIKKLFPLAYIRIISSDIMLLRDI